jgi:tetratricopeptide (TPR) repeat protein
VARPTLFPVKIAVERMCSEAFGATVVLYALFAADLHSARMHVQKGEIREGLREIEAALHSAPDDPEIQFEAGQLLREISAEHAVRLQQLAPDSAEAHQLLGRSLEARGQLNEALVEYRAALRNNPALPGLHFLIGNVLWKQRDLEEARKEFEAELHLNPNHVLANLRIGDVLLNLGEPKAAAEHLRIAVQADESSVSAHQSLGKAYRALGHHAEALQEFQFVARQRPNDESVHAQLAGEYRALGDSDKAKGEMELHRRLLEVRAAAARKK